MRERDQSNCCIASYTSVVSLHIPFIDHPRNYCKNRRYTYNDRTNYRRSFMLQLSPLSLFLCPTPFPHQLHHQQQFLLLFCPPSQQPLILLFPPRSSFNRQIDFLAMRCKNARRLTLSLSPSPIMIPALCCRYIKAARSLILCLSLTLSPAGAPANPAVPRTFLHAYVHACARGGKKSAAPARERGKGCRRCCCAPMSVYKG